MCVLTLEHALPLKNRNEFVHIDRSDSLEMFRRVRDRRLVDGAVSSLNAMHKLLQYGMRTSMNVRREERVI